MSKWCLLLVVAFYTNVALAATIPGNSTNPNGRVIGGTDAVLGQFPYMGFFRASTGQQFCGCSIITEYWVVSAAHCTIGPTVLISVVVGTVSESSGGTVHPIFMIVNHPEYDELTIMNDISLVQVYDPFYFSEIVQPIKISPVFIEGNIKAVVTGWGLTEFPGSTYPDTLQWLQLRTLSLEECRARHPVWNEFVFFSNLCTLTGAGEGVCFGDSGGPLVIGNYLVGIPSWVSPCAIGYPDVYARVSYHYPWISAITGM